MQCGGRLRNLEIEQTPSLLTYAPRPGSNIGVLNPVPRCSYHEARHLGKLRIELAVLGSKGIKF